MVPLSNKKFPARIWQTGQLFLMPFNSRNATHFVYLWRQFLYKYIQKIFWMTNNFVGLQYFLAVFDLGLKLCMFERATRPFVDTHFDTHSVYSVRNIGRVLLGLFRNWNTWNRRYLCSFGSYSVFGSVHSAPDSRMKGIRFTRNSQNTCSLGKFLVGNPTRPPTRVQT